MKLSFGQLFRLMFVSFSLYLLGDAFYRWDGFRYHSSFMEFIPSIALVSILWSIIALLASVSAWVLLRSIERVFHRLGLKITAEHLIAYFSLLVLLGVVTWQAKRFIWPQTTSTYQTKVIVFIAVSVLSLFLTWLVRSRTPRWIRAVHDRITPLVWLFGMIFLLSVPLVVYQTWYKDQDGVSPRTRDQSAVSAGKKPNILLVTFDALSARDMELFGYERETAPFITKWANRATVFTNLHSASNWTTPAASSLMTGKRVWTHRASHLQGAPPAKSNIESLPLVLRNNGYFNIAIVANPVASVRALGIANSFDVAPPSIALSTPHSLLGGGVEAVGFIDKSLYGLFARKIRLYDWIIKEDFIFGKVLSKISSDISQTTVPPEKAFNKFLEVLDSDPPEPFFAWIHLLPPHAPYLPPRQYAGMFDPSPEMRTYKSQWKIFKPRASYLKYDRFPSEIQPSITILRNRYDEFIRYCDNEFEKFMKLLTAKDKLNNTIIILSADHGENFEHSYLSHGGPFFYEPVTLIPLIIREPLQSQSRTVSTPAEQIDIPATILDFAGIPVPPWMEGRSLLPLIRGGQMSPSPVFSMNLEKNLRRGQRQVTKGVVTVWEGGYKFTRDLDEKKGLLFDLKDDPGELNNLFDNKPDIRLHLDSLILQSLEEVNERIASGEE